MQRKDSSGSTKAKWKDSFQKARSFSQSTVSISRKTSLYEEETTDKELQEYLESLKRKSGIRKLWSGDKFEKTVCDDEDKTPDISISSIDDNDGAVESFHSVNEGNDTDEDFKPNIVMLSRSLSPELNDTDSSSVQLMHGVQLAEFGLSDEDSVVKHVNIQLNNGDTLKSTASDPKEIQSIMNNLHLASEIDTEDEVAEEIDDDINNVILSESEHFELSKHEGHSSIRSSPEPAQSHKEKSGRRSRARSSTESTSMAHSYSMDFSTADEATTISERTEPKTYSESSRSSKSSRPSHRSSRSGHKSRSHRNASTSSTSKSISDHNRYTCDVGIQTGPDLNSTYVQAPPGLGIGMATGGARLGMQYVDPSPIATHVVSADAMEAMTAYNPAVVALTDMLRQQIRLVEQFVDANNRMYQAYTSNLDTNYKYTTLEDT